MQKEPGAAVQVLKEWRKGGGAGGEGGDKVFFPFEAVQPMAVESFF